MTEPPERMEQLLVLIPSELKARVRETARSKGNSMASEVRARLLASFGEVVTQ